MSASRPGIEVLIDIPGTGAPAETGCYVVYNTRMFLRRGDEVTAFFPAAPSRTVDGVKLTDHRTRLGRRQSIAAVEYSLLDMCEGGYREVIAAPHLCYGRRGLGETIPPDAMLRIMLWLQGVEPA